MLLFATSGVSIFKHYCEGTLQETNLFAEAGCETHHEPVTIETCCSDSGANSCHITSPDCCDETVEIQKINDFQVKAQQDIVLDIPALPLRNHVDHFFGTAVSKLAKANKSPPTTVPDICVLVQSFLL